jgi:hypothetical protein
MNRLKPFGLKYSLCAVVCKNVVEIERDSEVVGPVVFGLGFERPDRGDLRVGPFALPMRVPAATNNAAYPTLAVMSQGSFSVRTRKVCAANLTVS